MNHTARLRNLATDLEDLVCLDISDEVFNLRCAADYIDHLEALVNALDIQAMHPHMDGSHQCSIRANGRSLTPEQWDLILSCRPEPENFAGTTTVYPSGGAA